ncbi:hypothetical protein OIE65_05620 [Streptomyces sp. NBC_01800]|nr:hypothetical protein OIE65_05620 [Streptomyces sp. NBC_01800]
MLREAFYGIRRFDAFQESLGIARNTLNDRLRRLVDGGRASAGAVEVEARARERAHRKPLAAGLIGSSTAKGTPRLSPPGPRSSGQGSSQTLVPVGRTARAMPVRFPCRTRISRRFDPSRSAA